MTHKTAPAFAHTSGPKDAKLAFVGEAFGEQESLTGLPFVGNAGQLLDQLCREAGFSRRECFCTNVFAARPPDNKLEYWCGTKTDAGKDYKAPALRQGKYILPEYLPELDRLKEELCSVKPNLIVALGATAFWALHGSSAISAVRGTTLSSTMTGAKLLATYHPSYLFKMWSHYTIVVADLMKAKREREFPEIRRPKREVLVNPTIEEIENYVAARLACPICILATDVETSRSQITMVGFAHARDRAIVIPFVDQRGTNYWPSVEAECRARSAVNALLSSEIPKLTQNGLYDIQYFLREGYTLRNFREDTMLLHHAHYPELNKGLGFLGSLYTQEPAWKLMRKNKEEHKRDE
jgi:uracil-DNA glycosylase